MAKSQNSFIKQENEKKRLKKRKEKQQKKEERKLNPSESGFDSMIAYVDENGNPPKPFVDVQKDTIKLKTEGYDENVKNIEKEISVLSKKGLM